MSPLSSSSLLLFSFCLPLAATSLRGSNLSLLGECMSSIEKALDFVAIQTDEINLDALTILVLAGDQLQVLERTYGKDLGPDGVVNRPRLLLHLQKLVRITKAVVLDATPKVQKNQPDYFKALGKLTEAGRWAMSHPVRSLPKGVKSPGGHLADLLIPFNEKISDRCLSLLVGEVGNPDTPCNVTRDCWTFMTSSGERGYSVTHSVLYLLIAQQSGCQAQMDKMESDGVNVSVRQQDLCLKVLSEAKEIESNGYPPRERDLFMEQVFLCGLEGFRDFLRVDWLKTILSWQDLSGCYTRKEAEEPVYSLHQKTGASLIRATYADVKVPVGRRKREDVKLVGGCSAHLTSVALGSMLTSARFLLHDIVD